MMDQLPYERISIAVGAVAATQKAVTITTKYAKERICCDSAAREKNCRFEIVGGRVDHDCPAEPVE
jgi:alkylation response protein AidB-like acyl-CoA dehydrogenase